MIGILGGTFDPVHYGHLRPALEVMQALALEQLRFIPNHIPPHREVPWLPVETRQALLEIALADTPGFVLDTRELDRDGPSYTIDTLISLRAEYPGTTLCLIVGMDAFAGLAAWHRWQEILQYCHLVVTTRPGFDWPQNPVLAGLAACHAQHADELRTAVAGKILLQSTTLLEISSSAIRQQVREGQSIHYLLPEAVEQYLAQTLRS